MSDLVEMDSEFDIEAQEPLLEAGAVLLPTSARKKLRTGILVIQCTAKFFNLKPNHHHAISIAASSSTTFESFITQDSEDVEAGPSPSVEARADSSDEDENRWSANSTYDLEVHAEIVEIVRNKDREGLVRFGGLEKVAEALKTDVQNGIPNPGEPFNPPRCKKTFQFVLIILHSFGGACSNYTIILLSCTAVLSLVLGINEEGLHTGWLNGGVVAATVVIIVFVNTIRDSRVEWSRQKLENSWLLKGRISQVQVVREGVTQFVCDARLLAGDIAVLEMGDEVPGDGLLVPGHGEALELDATPIDGTNPFLFYGSRVSRGSGKMLVISTRKDSVWGEMMDVNESKFEDYLTKMSNTVNYVGCFIGALLLVVYYIRHRAGKLDEERRYRPDAKGEPVPVRTIVEAIKEVVTGSKGTAKVLTTLLTVTLLGLVEGIPFAISIAAFKWSSKMLEDKASARDYLAFAKMGSVTTIITDDELGGMMEHGMEIHEFYVGEKVVCPEAVEALCDGIGTQYRMASTDQELNILVSWAEEKLGMKKEFVTERCNLERSDGYDPLRGLCRALMEKRGQMYLHCKGPPLRILSKCSHHYNKAGEQVEMDKGKKRKLEKVIRDIQAEESVQVVAYAFKQVLDSGDMSFEADELIFLAMIKMEKTSGAVSKLVEAGINIILASRNSESVLQSIGQKNGLGLTTDHLTLTGEAFRGWDDATRRNEVHKIRILGNCLPSDKILLIKCLREQGQVVALLGQQTVDAPALKQADLGVIYGAWSSQIVRGCCHINILRGGCFGFLVNVIEKGVCFQESVGKFMQLQLILAVSSLSINFIAVVFSGDAPMTAAQLFWLNLVVGLVGSLGLLKGPSTKTLTTKPSARVLITLPMWRNIVIQALYQIIVFLLLQQKGQAILGTSKSVRVNSVIYNGFFLCQMFNMFIAREPEKKNFLSGLSRARNCCFWVAVVLFVICQMISAVAEELLGTSPGLSLKLWGVCLLVGFISCLLDWAGKTHSATHS